MAFIFVPYRGIYFLYHIAKFRYEYGAGFSSPIGESTFSTSFYPICVESLLQFSSPIGESAFSTRNNKIQEKEENDFRPLSGNLLSLQLDLSIDQIRRELIFVPYRGIYFLYSTPFPHATKCRMIFSSPIGESTFSTKLEF